jgi:hypothetical protein
MTKRAISVTLREEHLLWLRGRSRAARHRSVSDTLDRIIAEARTTAGAARTARSIKGTIRIAETDPALRRADLAIRQMFRTTPGRPARRLRRRQPTVSR